MQITREELEKAVIVVHKSLYDYWRSWGLRHQEAMDLAQEGIRKDLEKISEWRGDAKLTTYLTTVGKRAGIDYLRKEAREQGKKEIVFGILRRLGLVRTTTPKEER